MNIGEGQCAPSRDLELTLRQRSDPVRRALRRVAAVDPGMQRDTVMARLSRSEDAAWARHCADTTTARWLCHVRTRCSAQASVCASEHHRAFVLRSCLQRYGVARRAGSLCFTSTARLSSAILTFTAGNQRLYRFDSWQRGTVGGRPRARGSAAAHALARGSHGGGNDGVTRHGNFSGAPSPDGNEENEGRWKEEKVVQRTKRAEAQPQRRSGGKCLSHTPLPAELASFNTSRHGQPEPGVVARNSGIAHAGVCDEGIPGDAAADAAAAERRSGGDGANIAAAAVAAVVRPGGRVQGAAAVLERFGRGGWAAVAMAEAALSKAIAAARPPLLPSVSARATPRGRPRLPHFVPFVFFGFSFEVSL